MTWIMTRLLRASSIFLLPTISSAAVPTVSGGNNSVCRPLQAADGGVRRGRGRPVQNLPDGRGLGLQPAPPALPLHRQPAVRPPGLHQEVALLQDPLR